MNVLDGLIGIAVLALIVVRQLRVRPVAADARMLRIVAVLGLVGLVQVAAAAGNHPAPVLGWAVLVLGLLLGAGFGVWRARTVRIWSVGGRWVRQGTAATLALWVVGLAAHVGLDLLTRVWAPDAEALNTSSILLFVAVSLGAQAVVQAGRVRALAPARV